MQKLLKVLLTQLHAEYFKPQGFRKKAGRFQRQLDGLIQEVDFQSSQWNSAGEAITFYVNINIGFTDLTTNLPAHYLPGRGRIGRLVAGLPPQFDLSITNFSTIRNELVKNLSEAIRALPAHYEDVRQRAESGLITPIPLPDSWRADGSTKQAEQDGGGNSATLRASP